MKKYLIFLLIILVAIGAAWRLLVSHVEQPKYVLVQQNGSIEIRDYNTMIVAEVEVTGDRKTAINQGFRMLADYIFGNNTSSEKVAMTAPVTQQSNAKIAMTAPVTQQGDGTGNWKVRFIMPSTYCVTTLPRPNNQLVKIVEITPKRYAVIRFSGTASQQRLAQEQEKLQAFITQQGLSPSAQATYAFFNPPWTLPFLRRNEVMIEIKK